MKLTSKHPRFFRMTREVMQVWKYSGRSFLLFEFIFKLLTLTLFGPFLSVIFRKMLDLGGYQAVANLDLVQVLLSPYGLLNLLVLCPLAFILIYAEFAVLIYLAYYGRQKVKISVRSILMLVIKRFPKLWGLGFFGAAFYLIFLFPFFSDGIGASLLPGLKIPGFITGELSKTMLGTLALTLFLACVVILNILFIYALPILVLEPFNKFSRVFRKSINLFWQSKWVLIRTMFEWFIVSLFFLLAAIILLVATMFLFLLLNKREFSLLEINFIFSSAFYGLTLLATPLFITIITCLYVRYSDPKDIRVPSYKCVQGEDNKNLEEHKNFVYRHFNKLVTFVLVLVLVLGWGIAAVWTSWGEPKKDWLIMAHRGDIRSGVENTMEAFEGAVQAGADYIELDVLQTKDGKLAVIHDKNLKRLSGNNVNVYELTLDELQKITLVQNGFSGKIPSLDEVLEQLPERIKLNIELKTHGYEQNYVDTFVETLHHHNVKKNRIIVQSLEYDLVKQVKQLVPELKVGYIIFATFADLGRFHADFYVVEESFATARRITSAKLAGKPIFVWTVNTEEAVERFYTLGADGIITDISAKARAVIQDLKEPFSRESP